MGPTLLSPAETSDVLTFAVSVIKLRIIKDLLLGLKPGASTRLLNRAENRAQTLQLLCVVRLYLSQISVPVHRNAGDLKIYRKANVPAFVLLRHR